MSVCPRTAVTALTLLALGACGDPTPAAPPRRVILITCDTLRADRLGFAGYVRRVSPNLDALAAESVVFENAWSAAPLTGPALSSLLCGRFPDEIGAGPTNREIIPEEVVTIAEVVRDAGIATAAFVSNGVLRRPPPADGYVGLQQGFDVYDDEMNAKERNRNLLERTADACTDSVLRWLADQGDADPFFLWVHYQDPHGPYTPPLEHLTRLERPPITEDRLPRSTTNSGRGAIPKYQYIAGLETPQPYEDRYDAEIRFFDAEVGRLIDELRRRDMLDDSLLVFTSDHGEFLGEHDYWFCHGETVFRELVHVPFFVRFPRATSSSTKPPLGGARRVQDLVGHIDVWPTIVEAFGLDAPKSRGTSLFATQLPTGRVLPQFLGPVRNPNRHLGVTDGRWRVLMVKSSDPQLFDLSQDPGEKRDVAAANPDVIESLRTRYTEFMSEDMRPWSTAARPELDAATKRDLGNLGYTDGDDH